MSKDTTQQGVIGDLQEQGIDCSMSLIVHTVGTDNQAEGIRFPLRTPYHYYGYWHWGGGGVVRWDDIYPSEPVYGNSVGSIMVDMIWDVGGEGGLRNVAFISCHPCFVRPQRAVRRG